jgi:hypothetical protein
MVEKMLQLLPNALQRPDTVGGGGDGKYLV